VGSNLSEGLIRTFNMYVLSSRVDWKTTIKQKNNALKFAMKPSQGIHDYTIAQSIPFYSIEVYIRINGRCYSRHRKILKF
jgi:hypothetical protein